MKENLITGFGKEAIEKGSDRDRNRRLINLGMSDNMCLRVVTREGSELISPIIARFERKGTSVTCSLHCNTKNLRKATVDGFKKYPASFRGYYSTKGNGYHKQSSALEGALQDAGIGVVRGGINSERQMETALINVARLLRYKSKLITVIYS